MRTLHHGFLGHIVVTGVTHKCNSQVQGHRGGSTGKIAFISGASFECGYDDELAWAASVVTKGQSVLNSAYRHYNLVPLHWMSTGDKLQDPLRPLLSDRCF